MMTNHIGKSHGGDIYSAEDSLGINRSEIIDFSANIMPAGLSDNVRQAICDSIDDCRYYPDPQQRQLRSALAAHHRLEASQIVCGNGAADLIFRTVYALRPIRAYLPVPSFSEYERALREVGSEVHYWHLNEANNFRIDKAMLNWLREISTTSKLKSQDYDKQETTNEILFLCQPNNPTGLLIDPDILEQIIENCDQLGIYLLLDECFLDFISPKLADRYSGLAKLKNSDSHTATAKYQRLIVLKSLTKYYAMPGLRAGYICAAEQLAAKIMLTGQPWPVGTLAEAAALAILGEDDNFHALAAIQVQEWLSQERPVLEHALMSRDFIVWPGTANFIFFKAENCFELGKLLLEKGIIIRSCADYVGLGPEYFRIAVLSHSENLVLIRTLSNLRV